MRAAKEFNLLQDIPRHNATNGALQIPLTRNEFIFYLCKNWKKWKLDIPFQIHLFETESEAEEFYSNLFRSELADAEVFLYPGLQSHPYSTVIESEENLFSRIEALHAIHSNLEDKRPTIIVSSLAASMLVTPTPALIRNLSLVIQIDLVISPYQLASGLVELGYTSRDVVSTPGEFSHRGEIFDIWVNSNTIYRLTYFDDAIEKIQLVDTTSQRSIAESNLDKIKINATPAFINQSKFLNFFRNNVSNPGPKFSLRFEERKKVLESIQTSSGNHNLGKYFSLFLPEHEHCLLNSCQEQNFKIFFYGSIDFNEFQQKLRAELIDKFEEYKNDVSCEILVETPEKYYHLNNQIAGFIGIDNIFKFGARSQYYLELNQYFQNDDFVKKSKSAQEFSNLIRENKENFSKMVICFNNEQAIEELKFLLLEDDAGLKSRTEFFQCSLSTGFYSLHENMLVISETNFFTVKKSLNKKSRRKSAQSNSADFFAEQLASIKPGDYLVHATYGIGVFEGLQPLSQGDQNQDYVVINYSEGDKVYVPVYKLNLIQKYSSSENKVKVDSLRTNQFNNTKTKIRKSVKKLAFDLLKFQAERNSKIAPSFEYDSHIFKEFELDFPYTETPDQDQAIFETIDDLKKSKPMDRLVCGDVGFGKTEVAMRAAFRVAESGYQVAVLAPTTILALQHFNTFKERFKKFPLNIEMISRLRNPQEAKKINEKVKTGEVDILIGTHAILSDKIRFKNLGLLIIDEEHRFGVAQKEQIKVLKSEVHCLTLTATPIPRTLQMSFLGIKEFSLIKTPPPLKQSVNTILLKEDDHVLKQAIEFELGRGGQIFVVHNRVQDIEIYAERIRQLSPKSKIIIAHGQLAPKEIEKRIMSFYKGEYNILLATTIIESGIDIPNANTMIIFNSDLLGLAQLHQLRGRIGRSDKKAYAYLVIPKTKTLTNDSEKRLKALQIHSDLGSGFSLASSDLEIRGSGDILGAEQSGHINEIGLELYLDLLKEAMSELKGEQPQINQDFEISTPFDCQIPSHFIADISKRISYYKRISASQSNSSLSDLKSEIEDIYGSCPTDLENLFLLIETRNILSGLFVKGLKVQGNEITIQFNQDMLNNNPNFQNKVADVFLSNPGEYRFSPGYKVSYKSSVKLSPSSLLKFANNIAQQIIPC